MNHKFSYTTSEQLFQTCKFLHDNDLMKIIQQTRTPREAYELAKEHQGEVIKSWITEGLSIRAMDLALELKFKDPTLRQLLLETKNRPLVENSPTDSFWGIGRDGRGRNELGRALMRLRVKLRRPFDPKEEERERKLMEELLEEEREREKQKDNSKELPQLEYERDFFVSPYQNPDRDKKNEQAPRKGQRKLWIDWAESLTFPSLLGHDFIEPIEGESEPQESWDDYVQLAREHMRNKLTLAIESKEHISNGKVKGRYHIHRKRNI